MTMLTRSFDMTVRQAEGGEASGYEIEAIGVPFNREIEYGTGYFEHFEPGSVDDAGAILRYGHREPLGLILDASDATEGRKIRARISKTNRGAEVATLLRDGVLTKVSVGFIPEVWTDEEREDGTHRTFTKVRAIEYSIVEFPAYEDAEITDVRQNPNTDRKAPTMHDTPAPATEARDQGLITEVRSIAESLDDFQRETRSRFADLAAPATGETPFAFRSIGAYAKALARDSDPMHEQALAAYAGAVIGDAIARPAWLGVLDKRMNAKQEVTNLFTHTTDLPAQGMSVEYGQRAAVTGVKVGEQKKEGDALAKGKPAAYEVKNAPVKTYGGVGEMSFQAIDRASVSLLDDLLYDQAMVYASQIEAATRDLFTEKVTEAEASPAHTFASAGAATADDWTDFILALLDLYDATPYLLDGIAVSPTVFAALAKMDRDPKALQFDGAPADHHGTLTVATGRASFAQVTISRIPRWDGSHAVGYSREAIRIQENPGAPLRLQDSDIVDLSKTFAVYGYAAHYAPHAELLKAAKFTA